MIIGVTGKICAGHDTLGKILEDNGFVRYSLSDDLRQFMKSEGIKVNRDNMRNFGDELRKSRGSGILASLAVSRLNGHNHYVVESFRNPYEVYEFRRRGNFYFIAVDAPAKIRFDRLLVRGRDVDEPKTFEEFIEWEKRDLGIGQPVYGQQQLAFFQIAD